MPIGAPIVVHSSRIVKANGHYGNLASVRFARRGRGPLDALKPGDVRWATEVVGGRPPGPLRDLTFPQAAAGPPCGDPADGFFLLLVARRANATILP